MHDQAGPATTSRITPPVMVGASGSSRKRKERDADSDPDEQQQQPATHRPAPFLAPVVSPPASPAAADAPSISDSSPTPSPAPRDPTASPHAPSPKPPPADAGDEDQPSSNATGGGGGAARTDEYEAGRVVCEACGSSVSFRDDANGGFTLKHWEAHRNSCPAAPSRPPPSSGTTATTTGLYTTTANTPGPNITVQPLSPSSALHNHPTLSALHGSSMALSLGASNPKRRRAKRTEEERIEYLRSDPYVAEFEAYRVLCASCDKWIRLRPNSTYCSIPWDAHRKSCLAKKVTAKNPYALSERNTLFSKDPDVRKFDPERLLCNLCDRWIALPGDDHLGAVQTWLGHRAGCGRRARGGIDADGDGGDEEERENGAEDEVNVKDEPRPSTAEHDPSTPVSSHPTRFPPITPPSHHPSSNAPGVAGDPASHPTSAHSSSTPPYLLTPLTYAPSHESRRRNAEQRAATLRADRLIGRVEPNRVFCSLCQKWVQLRQDSSYCAYPWVQHRGKCLRRSERRNAKAAEIGHGLPPKHSSSAGQGGSISAAGPSSSGSFTRRPMLSYPTYPSHYTGAQSGSSHPSSSSRPYAHAHQRHHNHHRDQPHHSLQRNEGSSSSYQHHQPQHHANAHRASNIGAGGVDEDEDQLMSDSVPPEHDDHDMERAGAPVVSDSEEGSEMSDDPDVGAGGGVRDVDVESEDGTGIMGGEISRSEAQMSKKHLAGDGERVMGSSSRHAAGVQRHHHNHHRKEYPPVLGSGLAPRHARPQHHNATGARGHGQQQHQQHQQHGGKGYPHSMHTSGSRYAPPGPTNAGGQGSSSMSQAIGFRNAAAVNSSGTSAGPCDLGRMDGEDGGDVDAEGEADLDGEGEWVLEDGVGEGGGGRSGMMTGMGTMGKVRGVPRRPHPVGLADLDSPDGRKQFIHTSLTHLFGTTYEPTDDLSISSLLAYLNAAMPPDKHEDFDTTEVARAVGALAERGRVRFEGDVLRIVP